MNKLEEQQRKVYKEVCAEIASRLEAFEYARDKTNNPQEVMETEAQIGALEALLWHFEKNL